MNDLKPFLERSLSSLPVSPLAVLLVIALLIGVMMSFYTIPAESEGIVLRFGKYVEKVPSGLHAKLPFGIDNVIPVPTQRQQKLEFVFATLGYTNPDQISNEPALEKSMVTGDLNAALVEWIVQYRITDPEKFAPNCNELKFPK